MRTFALTLPFPAGKWLDSSLPSQGRFCGCPQIWKRIGVFSQEHTIKSEKVPGNKSPRLSAEEPGAAGSVNIQPFLLPGRQEAQTKEQENNSTVSDCQGGQGSKSPWSWKQISSFACIKLAIWKEASCHSSITTVLLVDNTFKDIKMFPSAYCLSPYWLYWQNCVKPTQQAPPGCQHGLEQHGGDSQEKGGCFLKSRANWTSFLFTIHAHSFIQTTPLYWWLPSAWPWEYIRELQRQECFRIRYQCDYLQSSFTVFILNKDGKYPPLY